MSGEFGSHTEDVRRFRDELREKMTKRTSVTSVWLGETASRWKVVGEEIDLVLSELKLTRDGERIKKQEWQSSIRPALISPTRVKVDRVPHADNSSTAYDGDGKAVRGGDPGRYD
jgi:hypothetical protein